MTLGAFPTLLQIDISSPFVQGQSSTSKCKWHYHPQNLKSPTSCQKLYIMSQNRPHSLRAKIASVVVMALLGAVLALAVTTDSYGLPPWPYWSDMTGYDKLLLVALPCLGALTGALFVWSSMVKPRPIPRQTSTSETEPPRPNSIGKTISPFPKPISTLTRLCQNYLNIHRMAMSTLRLRQANNRNYI